MQQTLSISNARKQLPSLIDDIQLRETSITVNGQVRAVLVDAEEYENLKETLEILGDTHTMKTIQKSLEDIRTNKLDTWENVKSKLGL